MKKFYAIKKGRKIGVFDSWEITKKYIEGFSGAIYKGFSNKKDADKWLKNDINSEPNSNNSCIKLYTDGGSRNTGNKIGEHVRSTDKAAWAYLILIGDSQYSASDGEYGSTNNRMELLGLLNGLNKLLDLKLNKQTIEIILDSKYIFNALNNHWITKWANNNWCKSDGEKVANCSCWQQILSKLVLFSNIKLSWTKGHADNWGNNFVDKLLNDTMDKMA